MKRTEKEGFVEDFRERLRESAGALFSMWEGLDPALPESQR